MHVVALQVIDARPAGRFAGVDPEPRPGLPSGHMPGAKSVPFMQVGCHTFSFGRWARFLMQ
jgi:3-mercaptopyruvate sulfurtransferase SseA